VNRRGRKIVEQVDFVDEIFNEHRSNRGRPLKYRPSMGWLRTDVPSARSLGSSMTSSPGSAVAMEKIRPAMTP